MYFDYPVFFEIPVRPRVRKFVTAKLCAADGTAQPLLITPETSGISLNLWGLCQSQKVMQKSGWRKLTVWRSGDTKTGLLTDGAGRVIAPVDMTERLGLGIREFHQSRHQYLLNHSELETFSSWVDYVILNEMVEYCRAAPKTAPLLRIKAFTDKYDFSTDDLNEEALRQTYYRSRAGKSSYNFSPTIVRQLHFQPLTDQRMAA